MEELKKCSKCNKIKDLIKFSKQKGGLKGVHSSCKKCIKVEGVNYRKSKAGVIATIYGNLKNLSKVSGKVTLNFTKEDFSNWILKQVSFINQYKLFKTSGFEKNNKPAVRKIDELETYTIDNLKIMSLKESSQKASEIRGLNRRLKTSKRTSRKCPSCKVELPFSNFHKDKGQPNGYHYTCKTCMIPRSREYSRSKEGILTNMMARMKRRGALKNISAPNFNKEELIKWVTEQNIFHILYDNYVSSNYKSEEKPSIDRIDDHKGYQFDNMQLMTWGENYKKSRRDIKNGNNTKTSRGVIQVTPEGVTIKEFHSITQASRELGVSISMVCRCCTGDILQVKGLYFKYKRNLTIVEKAKKTCTF